MKTYYLLIALLLLPLSVAAQQERRHDVSQKIQESNQKAQENLQHIQDQLKDWNTEHRLDSLDQEHLPRPITFGLLFGPNISNFVIRNNDKYMSSYMKIGGELIGYMDCRVTNHFYIQPQVGFVFAQNQFGVEDERDRIWSLGFDITGFFMGRYGNMEKGYAQFGAGPYMYFAVSDEYTNNEATLSVDDLYSRLYQLHGAHAGLAASVSYELPFRMLINFTYRMSLSDIYTYNKTLYDAKSDITSARIYPQRCTLTLGYHFK